MKQFALMSLVLTLLGLSGQAFAIPIITLDPHPTVIHPGENLLVDVNVSGLQFGGTNSLLGAFSMDVLFEPNLSLDFIQLAASTFDNALGNVSAGEAIVGTDPWVPGSGKVSFYEVSLLDSAALAAKQSDSFRLATLIFYLPSFNTLPTGTPIILSTANIVLSDDLGNKLLGTGDEPCATGGNSCATVSVSEPPSILLLGIGLMIPLCLRRKLWSLFKSDNCVSVLFTGEI